MSLNCMYAIKLPVFLNSTGKNWLGFGDSISVEIQYLYMDVQHGCALRM